MKKLFWSNLNELYLCKKCIILRQDNITIQVFLKFQNISDKTTLRLTSDINRD
jgi:hypothetical protein